METVVITRHQALVKLLIEKGIITPETPIINHATSKDVENKHVIGVLPLSLACLADKVTEIPLALTPEMRGKELSLEEIRKIAGEPVTYKVKVY